MSNSYFRFKRFTVRHDRCAMKVGTDGVLLGAWTDIKNTGRILDVGTGSGLIALMLAQRTETVPDVHITALEIDKDSATQASENVAASPWSDRIEVINEDFKNYNSEKNSEIKRHHEENKFSKLELRSKTEISFESKENVDSESNFDLIVSNPPYFEDSLKCPDKKRSTTRHTDTLSFEDLISHSLELLRPRGRLDIIIPTQAWEKVKEIAIDKGFIPVRVVEVYTKPEAQSKRMLVSLSKSDSMIGDQNSGISNSTIETVNLKRIPASFSIANSKIEVQSSKADKPTAETANLIAKSQKETKINVLNSCGNVQPQFDRNSSEYQNSHENQHSSENQNSSRYQHSPEYQNSPERLYIETSDHVYSDEFNYLVKDFYLDK